MLYEMEEKVVKPPREDLATPIWASPEPGTRRPRFSREQIAAVALAIADAEGFEAVSMRRVATELGAGTMTLYHYVRTKDDLTALMGDAIIGEFLVPDEELGSTWRERLTAIAHQSRSALLAHPWANDAIKGSQSGPNTLRHFEQSLKAVSDLGLNNSEQMELITTLDDFVIGSVIRHLQAVSDSSAISPNGYQTMFEYIEKQLKTGNFPEITRFFGDEDVTAGFMRLGRIFTDVERFDRGLKQLLDGIEIWLDSRSK
jgi:AcrR family transcriptional regulator